MIWLFLTITWLIDTICDFCNLSPYKYRLQALPSDEKARRKFRILRGLGSLLLTVCGGCVFVANVIYRIKFTWMDVWHYLVPPFFVLILYQIILRVAYKIPWNENKQKHDQMEH